VMGAAIKADLTVTMALLKRGLLLHPGAAHAGAVRVADIGMPPQAVERENIQVTLLDRGSLWGLLSPRGRDSHKGSFGHVLVVAGSLGRAGAAVMAARSALRTGAGLVSVATPNGLVPIIQQSIAEAMCVPAAESIDGTLGIGAEHELINAASKMDACAIGPGLSTHAETALCVRNLVPALTIPMVVDADGLNALAGSVDILKKAKAPVIVTPHPGEMARLSGVPAADVQKDRIGIASAFAKTFRVTVVLKGAGTIVASPAGQVFVNSTGNPGMATGGTGDALTGMIASFLAQGHTAEQAACLGVYLQGLAGDLAAGEQGEAGMITGDLIEKIPQAIQTIVEGNGNTRNRTSNPEP
jgi:hydroxyethylthiazole kinase-like uncharacterized protein yjeF